ncbi:MAG: hypothetical protein HRF46_07235, partial [Acidobacteriota bacterium]
RESTSSRFSGRVNSARMRALFTRPEKREEVLSRHGEQKYAAILELIDNPEGLPRTYATLLPRFLHSAVTTLRPELATPADGDGAVRAAAT